MYIDSHANLNFKAFASDFESAILRAEKAGVEKIINVGSNLKTSIQAVEIAKKYDGVFAAVGLHPVHVKDEEFLESKFLELSKEKKVVAIGETGLDYFHDKKTAELQKEILVKQLNLATRLNKPVILHSREAGDDLLSILTGQKSLPKGVLHCFSEDWHFAQIILEMGFYISFTGVITFTKRLETFEVIKNAPIERILIETDCPFLTPRLQSPEATADGGQADPYRGQRNEPAYVVSVAKKIAEIKKMPLEKIAETTSKNAEELFNI